MLTEFREYFPDTFNINNEADVKKKTHKCFKHFQMVVLGRSDWKMKE